MRTKRIKGKVIMCSCGHPPTEREKNGVGTGYSLDRRGRTCCYKCCGERDRADMIRTGCACLYLVDRETDERKRKGYHNYHVTNWPSSRSFHVYYDRVSRNNLGTRRHDVWFLGPDGHIWHGVNLGDMNLTRCKRTKKTHNRGTV